MFDYTLDCGMVSFNILKPEELSIFQTYKKMVHWLDSHFLIENMNFVG